MLLKERKVYIPKDEELQTEIIQLHHNTLAVGHKEQLKIVELVTRNFWQPKVIWKIKECGVYQRNKNHMDKLAGKLRLNKIPEKP